MSKQKIVLLVGFVVVVLFLFVWTSLKCAPLGSCPWAPNTNQKVRKVVLTFAAAWDSSEDWKEVVEAFKAYEETNKRLSVQINFERIDGNNYENILLDKQLTGNSPNIFMIYNSWLPKYEKRIVPFPSEKLNVRTYEGYFAKAAKDDFVKDDKIYSLPIYMDTLALYYNKEMLRNAGLAGAPKTWDEFATYVEKLTRRDIDGKIKVMGAALGGGEEVNRSQDVLMLLVMQNNIGAKDRPQKLWTFRTPEALKAVKYYTDFANSQSSIYTWDYDNQTYSIDAFVQGKAAMMIGYSYQLENLKNKVGGSIEYGVAPLPQQYPEHKVNLASYWSPVVSKDATCVMDPKVTVSCQEVAWDFLNFAAQPQNAKLYLEKTHRPAALLSLAKEQSLQVNSDLSAFGEQVFTAQSWPNAYNDKTDRALLNMIESVITTNSTKKKTVEAAMRTVQGEIFELND